MGQFASEIAKMWIASHFLFSTFLGVNFISLLDISARLNYFYPKRIVAVSSPLHVLFPLTASTFVLVHIPPSFPSAFPCGKKSFLGTFKTTDQKVFT